MRINHPGIFPHKLQHVMKHINFKLRDVHLYPIAVRIQWLTPKNCTTTCAQDHTSTRATIIAMSSSNNPSGKLGIRTYGPAGCLRFVQNLGPTKRAARPSLPGPESAVQGAPPDHPARAPYHSPAWGSHTLRWPPLSIHFPQRAGER